MEAHMRSTRLALIALVLAAGPAAAQEVKTPRLELGGSIAGILPIFFPDGPVFLAGAGPRLALNLSRRIGLQLYADAVGPVESSGLNGLYAGDVKLPLRRSRDGQRTLSFTVGLCAPFQYTRVPERRVTRADGSVVVRPGFQRFRANSPTTLIAGITRDHAFSRSASSSFSLQALVGPIGGVALRAAVGVSFGAGGYR
jgi:hypothetical protein